MDCASSVRRLTGLQFVFVEDPYLHNTVAKVWLQVLFYSSFTVWNIILVSSGLLTIEMKNLVILEVDNKVVLTDPFLQLFVSDFEI